MLPLYVSNYDDDDDDDDDSNDGRDNSVIDQ
jgi:hypothetical protein